MNDGMMILPRIGSKVEMVRATQAARERVPVVMSAEGRNVVTAGAVLLAFPLSQNLPIDIYQEQSLCHRCRISFSVRGQQKC